MDLLALVKKHGNIKNLAGAAGKKVKKQKVTDEEDDDDVEETDGAQFVECGAKTPWGRFNKKEEAYGFLNGGYSKQCARAARYIVTAVDPEHGAADLNKIVYSELPEEAFPLDAKHESKFANNKHLQMAVSAAPQLTP
jgi:hypothetical protein